MRKVLATTLGDTPLVVTEALDKLRAEGIDINEVILLCTRDVDTKASAELLVDHVPRHYSGTIIYPIVTDAYADIDSDSAVLDFMQEACQTLKTLRKRGWDIYASIAGGRKSMSALMTLAVQLYGATRLFHVLVTDLELEEQGKITALRHRPDREELPHPPVESVRLVQLPFVGLFPWLHELLNGLQGHEVSREIKNLLATNGLPSPDGTSTDMGNVVRRILEDVEMLPEPNPYAPEVHISASEPRYRDVIDRLITRLQPLPWLRKIQTIAWRQGMDKTSSKEVGIIEVYQSTGGPSIGLRLETTAKTPAQTERVQREVERRLGW
jgi:CRISPR-associated protein Csx14